MTHTKGEWKVEKRTMQLERTIFANNKRICEVKSFGAGFNDPTEKQADANAKLITAAPDMLKALKEIKERLDKCKGLPISNLEVFDSFYQEIIDEAIKKAE